MESTFQFPLTGWQFDGSNSYGAAELYRAIPHVVVKIFPEHQQELAKETFNYLKVNGLSTTMIDEAMNCKDNKLYFYVFAERNEFLSARDKLFPHIQITN